MFRVLSCLGGEHDLLLVALAGVVCFLASLVAVNLFRRGRATRERNFATWVELAGAAKQAEEQLREQKLQLDTALNNMTQGLNMFDTAGRLVVCNERYLEM